MKFISFYLRPQLKIDIIKIHISSEVMFQRQNKNLSASPVYKTFAFRTMHTAVYLLLRELKASSVVYFSLMPRPLLSKVVWWLYLSRESALHSHDTKQMLRGHTQLLMHGTGIYRSWLLWTTFKTNFTVAEIADTTSWHPSECFLTFDFFWGCVLTTPRFVAIQTV